MARDKIHEAVKNALVKDGWLITHDPYTLQYEEVTVHVDLAAQKLFAAEKEGRKIAVEIKSFLNRSGIHDFERALGQYVLYDMYMDEIEPERQLYLAVSNFTYRELFSRRGIQFAIQKKQMKIIVIDLSDEEIEEWINN